MLVKNSYLYKRLKHSDISYYDFRDLEEQKRIKITYILITEIVANRFTKLLKQVVFEKFKSMLSLVDDSAKY